MDVRGFRVVAAATWWRRVVVDCEWGCRGMVCADLAEESDAIVPVAPRIFPEAVLTINDMVSLTITDITADVNDAVAVAAATRLVQ